MLEFFSILVFILHQRGLKYSDYIPGQDVGLSSRQKSAQGLILNCIWQWDSTSEILEYPF